MIQSTFDYIIVGGGTAGCTLAARLAEDPDVSVIILEAGEQTESWESTVPIAGTWLPGPGQDWQFETEPEPGLLHRKIQVAQPKVLGGGSTIGEMMYARGNADDYQGWYRAGLIDWAYDKVLPYFKKSECNLDSKDNFHGRNGQISVKRNTHTSVLTKQFIKAAESTGYRNNEDYNGKHQDGFGPAHFTVDQSGVRCTLDKGVASFSNIKRKLNCLVDRVIFEKKTAVGVQTVRFGEEEEYRCNKEIILCAGPYNTPAILQRSGVGDVELLDRLGIHKVRNIPAVGRGLQDHLYVPMCIQLKPGFSLNAKHAAAVSEIDENRESLNEEAVRAIYTSKGLDPNFPPIPITGFVRSEPLVLQKPDIQYILLPVLLGGPWIESNACIPSVPEETMDIIVALLNPASRGSVAITSRNPADNPSIKHNYLEEKRDLDTLKTAIGKMREILSQPELEVVYRKEVVPGQARDLEEHIRETAWTMNRPAGSCRMARDEKDSVCDYKGRVWGLKQLRIADSSLMPGMPAGSVTTVANMIAEKISDYVKADNAPYIPPSQEEEEGSKRGL